MKKNNNTEEIIEMLQNEDMKEMQSFPSKNIDAYLQIAFDNYFFNSKAGSEALTIFSKITDMMQEKVSKEEYIDDIEGELLTVYNDLVRYVSLQAMHLTVAIENGDYVGYL